jgi:hypothetical protein
MKEIPLTQGKVALVNDEDYTEFGRLKWQTHRGAYTNYAGRWVRHGPGRKREFIQLHRAIMQAPPGIDVDHIDGNGLNCQRENMRRATRQQNCINTRIRCDNTTGFRGVVLRGDKFDGHIKVGGRKLHLGRFSTATAAALAYDRAALQYHGEYARLNFPQGIEVEG